MCRVKQKNSDYLERDASASLLFTTFTTACWTSNSSPHQPSYYYSVPPHFFRKESFFNFNCIFVASSRESKSPAVSVDDAVALMPQKGEMKRENGCLFFWKKLSLYNVYFLHCDANPWKLTSIYFPISTLMYNCEAVIEKKISSKSNPIWSQFLMYSYGIFIIAFLKVSSLGMLVEDTCELFGFCF